MSYSNGHIRKPAHIEDVRQCLGVSDGDLKTIVDAGLHDPTKDINKWSKYKPVRYDSVAPLTESQRRYAKHGLAAPVLPRGKNQFNELAALIAGIISSSPTTYERLDWEYLRPRGDRTPYGGIHEWYRVEDFVNPDDANKGYNHYAGLPFTTGIVMDGLMHVNILASDLGYNEYDANVYGLPNGCVKFEVRKSPVADITLFEILDSQFGISTGETESWRLKAEVYRNDADWYSRQALATFFSDPITSEEDYVAVEVSLGDPSVFPRNSQFRYICVGFVRCADNQGNGYVDGSGFVAPWDSLGGQMGAWPFLYAIRAVSYFDRKIRIEGVGRGPTVEFTLNGSFWEGRVSSGDLWLHLQISRAASVMYFVKPNWNTGDGYMQMGVACYEISDTIFVAQPINTSRQNQNSVTIPSGNDTQYTDLYMYVSGNVFPSFSGERYYALYIFSRTYNVSNNEWDSWVNVGTINMHHLG